MFSNYIYLNMDRIKQYARKVGMKSPILVQSTEKLEKELGVGGKAKFVSGGVSGKQETVKQYDESPNDEEFFEEFEKKLKRLKEDEFVDFENYDDFNNFDDIKKQSIIKFEAKLKIPNKFGEVDFIKKILEIPSAKQGLASYMSDEDDTLLEEFFIEFIKDNKSIPIYFEFKEYKLYSNIKSCYFKEVDYSEFEENVDEEVTIVAKVEKVDKIEKEIILFNIYKEFLGFNREMCRSLSSSNTYDIPEQLTIKGKGIKLEILAIYK